MTDTAGLGAQDPDARPALTRKGMLDSAERALRQAVFAAEEALEWLRSDWQPLGSELTEAQVRRRDALRRAAQDAITTLLAAVEGRADDHRT